MPEPLARWLATDLNQALIRGAGRDPLRPAGGGRWLLTSALTCAVAALGLTLAGGYHAGFATLNGTAASVPDWTWQWLTMLGDERVAFALSLFFARRHPRVFWTLVCAGLLAAAYSRGLKPLVDAARPPAVLEPGSFQLIGPGHRKHSFPSGHGVTAGVLFGVLAYYARRDVWRVLFLLLALTGGLSRVAVGVHWPVDVAAGLAGGLLAALGGAALARRSRWGIVDAGVHLVFITAAVVMAIGLLVDDGGYRDAARMLQLLGGGALVAAAGSYILIPLRHWRHRLDVH